MSFNVLVVGAGPAGSVTARELARRGCRVRLIDRATFPRSKVCGCCLNGAAIQTLHRIGLGHVLAGAVRLDRVSVAAGSRSAELQLPRGVAISRRLLDARLVEAAVKAGVEFQSGVNVPLHRETTVADTAEVIVNATGLSGGEAANGSRIGAGVVLPAEAVPDFYRPHMIYMATGRGGYVGLVRLEDDQLDVAAAFDATFVRSCGGTGPAAAVILNGVHWPVPAGLADSAWKGTPALTRRPQRLANRGVFVVGDAAGYVEPFTGEGIAWALMSAVALAPIAARAVTGWNDRLAREWERTHRRIVGRRQRVCRTVSRVLRSPLLTGLTVRVLQTFPGLSRPVVSALNRPA